MVWATVDSSGRRSRAIARGWTMIAPSTIRPCHVDMVRSESQASAARSSGRRTATAEYTMPPTCTDELKNGDAMARSAAKRTTSATTSWLRLNRQPSRIPTPKMTHE